MTYITESAAAAIAAGDATIEQIATVMSWPIVEGCLVPEPNIWHADDGNAEITEEHDSGYEAAQSYVDTGDWGESDETSWITVYVWREAIDEDGDIVRVDEDRHKIEVEPKEPECIDGNEHYWRSPYEIVGGCKENPGVYGSGGGVTIQEVCMHCGCGKLTDTWAQDRNDGQQGLTSVKYEPEKYRDQRLQIYVDRNDGCGPVLDGCWGSENASFAMSERADAVDAMRSLAENYPGADWVLMTVPDGDELERIEASVIEEEQ